MAFAQFLVAGIQDGAGGAHTRRNPVCWKQDENVSYLSPRPVAGPDCGRLSMLGRFQTEAAHLLRSRSQSAAGADDAGGKDRPDDAGRTERAEGPGGRGELLSRLAAQWRLQRPQGRQQPEGVDRPLRPLAGAHAKFAAKIPILYGI